MTESSNGSTVNSNNNSNKSTSTPDLGSDNGIAGLPGVIEEREPTQTTSPTGHVDSRALRTESVISVDHNTQTENGAIGRRPTLHIPGETGELAPTLIAEDDSDLENSFTTPAKMKHLYAQFRKKKIKYKLTFTASVAALLTIALSIPGFPWFLPYFHTVLFPVLAGIRIYVYITKNFQLFLLDFCYFCNIGLLVYCWAYPQSQALQAVMFGAINGPVAMAIVIFRNSMVFHDYDRMTSGYIHVVPVVITYVTRWDPEHTSRYWYSYPVKFGEEPMYNNATAGVVDYLPNWVDPAWLWLVGVPLLWFTLHMLAVMFFENCVCNNEKYLTSFKWLNGSKSTVYNLLTICGRVKRHGKLMWFLFNLLYAVVSTLIARLCYEYVYVHLAWVLILILASIYNGASFFIDVFAKRGLEVENV